MSNNKKIMFFHAVTQDLAPTDAEFDTINNISKYEDNSLDVIIIQDLLDYIPREDTTSILQSVVSKLKKGGSLYIQGMDFNQLGAAISFDMMDANIIKEIMYLNKRSIHEMSEIITYLKNLKLKPKVKKYINIIEYYIEAYKHE